MDVIAFYVLCPVPNLLADIDWKIKGSWLRSRIIDELEATIMPDLNLVLLMTFG